VTQWMQTILPHATLETMAGRRGQCFAERVQRAVAVNSRQRSLVISIWTFQTACIMEASNGAGQSASGRKSSSDANVFKTPMV